VALREGKEIKKKKKTIKFLIFGLKKGSSLKTDSHACSVKKADKKKRGGKTYLRKKAHRFDAWRGEKKRGTKNHRCDKRKWPSGKRKRETCEAGQDLSLQKKGQLKTVWMTAGEKKCKSKRRNQNTIRRARYSQDCMGPALESGV